MNERKPNHEPSFGAELFDMASQLFREIPDAKWDEMSAIVVDAVRRAPRLSWPLTAWADAATPAADDSIAVSDHVVRSTVAEALKSRVDCAPTSIEFDIDGSRLIGVHIELTGSYGAALLDIAEQVRRTVASVLLDLLGETAAPAEDREVDVVISDVVVGDPHFA